MNCKGRLLSNHKTIWIGFYPLYTVYSSLLAYREILKASRLLKTYACSSWQLYVYTTDENRMYAMKCQKMK